jgi:2-hydroxychromene-2-carboxylate isomerase
MGHDRLREIVARHGAQINLRVMDLGKVFPASGGLALKDRPPQRRAYRMMELKRWRDFLGVPLNPEPKHFPVPAEPAATAILSVLERHGTSTALDVAGDLLRAIWAEDRNISDPETLAEILRARKLDADSLLAHARSAEVAARYIQHSQEAIARGVFGSPTYVYQDELFWGQDRLDFLERASPGEGPGLLRCLSRGLEALAANCAAPGFGRVEMVACIRRLDACGYAVNCTRGSRAGFLAGRPARLHERAASVRRDAGSALAGPDGAAADAARRRDRIEVSAPQSRVRDAEDQGRHRRSPARADRRAFSIAPAPDVRGSHSDGRR